MRYLFKKILNISVGLIILSVITILLLEGVIRIFPQILPIPLIATFDEELRAKTAQKIGLQTKSDLIEYPDARGVAVEIYKPDVNVMFPTHPDDEAEGGVSEMKMDSIGFCNVPEAFIPETIPVIVTGDSFTWCTAVKSYETWASALELLLKVDVYNIGKQNQGLDEEVFLIEKFGVQKKPKIVVMAVYEGNDIREAIRYEDLVAGSKKNLFDEERQKFCALPQKICPAYKYVKEKLGSRSYTFNILNVLIRTAYVRTYAFFTDKNVHNVHNPFPYKDFSYKINDSGVIFNKENHDKDEPELALALMQGSVNLSVFDKSLEKFMALSKEYDFTPVILYIPAAYTTYEHIVEFSDKRLTNLMREFSVLQREYFAKKAQELNYIFYDLTPDLQSVAPQYTTKGNLLYFPVNVHFTPIGHQKVAELLAEKLNQYLITQ